MEIGAFRTYPADYTPPDAAASEYQPIPLEKIEDFGVHADRYYALDVSIFKTSLDTNIINLLWNKYWVNTLAASPLLSNRAFLGGQLADVSAHLSCCAMRFGFYSFLLSCDALSCADQHMCVSSAHVATVVGLRDTLVARPCTSYSVRSCFACFVHPQV